MLTPMKPFSDVVGLNLPFYNYHCERWVKDPYDYSNGPGAPPHTWDYLYSLFCITSTYYFVEPLYYQGTDSLYKMVFATPECANCELTGTRAEPEFPIALK
jgi:hypothetical protein